MGQAASGVRFGTARLATGPTLHYAERGGSDGPAILFLHGWPDSWFSFSRVLPLLPAPYHAFAIDHRGFGDSERPDGGYAIDDLAADAAAFWTRSPSTARPSWGTPWAASSPGESPSRTRSGSSAWC